MKRRVSLFFSAACLMLSVLFGATSYLHPIAYSRTQILRAFTETPAREPYWSAERPTFLVALRGGILTLQRAPALPLEKSSFKSLTSTSSWDFDDLLNDMPSRFKFAGFSYKSQLVAGNPQFEEYTISALNVPVWFPASLALFATLISARRFLIPECHTACPTCCYDLRAHRPGDKCPECGTPIAQTQGRSPDSQ